MNEEVKPHLQFAVRINNEGYKVSLEVGKLYRIMPDQEAESHV